MIFGRL